MECKSGKYKCNCGMLSSKLLVPLSILLIRCVYGKYRLHFCMLIPRLFRPVDVLSSGELYPDHAVWLELYVPLHKQRVCVFSPSVEWLRCCGIHQSACLNLIFSRWVLPSATNSTACHYEAMGKASRDLPALSSGSRLPHAHSSQAWVMSWKT